MTSFSRQHPYWTSFALALGAAIALGFARFSYGLLLPVMKEDLGWSYLVAGTMNTANALGYLIGALTSPALMRRMSIGRFFVYSCLITALFLFLSGLTDRAFDLFNYRVLAGIASAWVFVAGGVLASQMAHLHSTHSGLMLGIFYGGPGLGIAWCSGLLPEVNRWAQAQGFVHPWQWSWYALGLMCVLMTILLARAVLSIPAPAPKGEANLGTPLRSYLWILAGYFMFGVGYIGYMTFIVALLKQMGLEEGVLHTFYAMLGVAVMLSPRIWAQLLQRYRGGQPLALLNTLLGMASLIPCWLAMTEHEIGVMMLGAVFFSGLLFGSVFLSAVASTTAFVKHNMPSSDWVGGITAFTSIFAVGQIFGPSVIGWISDGEGGLAQGLLISGLSLIVGGALAFLQKPLDKTGLA